MSDDWGGSQPNVSASILPSEDPRKTLSQFDMGSISTSDTALLIDGLIAALKSQNINIFIIDSLCLHHKYGTTLANFREEDEECRGFQLIIFQAIIESCAKYDVGFALLDAKATEAMPPRTQEILGIKQELCQELSDIALAAGGNFAGVTRYIHNDFASKARAICSAVEVNAAKKSLDPERNNRVFFWGKNLSTLIDDANIIICNFDNEDLPTIVDHRKIREIYSQFGGVPIAKTRLRSACVASASAAEAASAADAEDDVASVASFAIKQCCAIL